MAVKRLEVINPTELDLPGLVAYLKMIGESIHTIPTKDFENIMTTIVICLARAAGSYSELCELCKSVEEFLTRVMMTVDEEIQYIIIKTTLSELHSQALDIKTCVNPPVTATFEALKYNDEAVFSALRQIIQENEKTRALELRITYAYLLDWTSSETEWSANIEPFTLNYIKALEETRRFDILVEVSIERIYFMFRVLSDRVKLRQPGEKVLFHLLSSLRQSEKALESIHIHVPHVLSTLASNSNEYGRKLLEIAVNILKEMVKQLSSSNKNDSFKHILNSTDKCLEQYMSSKKSKFLELRPWCVAKDNTNPIKIASHPLKKIGLSNNGNTCYVNCILQALLLTKTYGVMLQATTDIYWLVLGELFGIMVYSTAQTFNPVEYVHKLRPPNFAPNVENDSSEFMCHLLQLLAGTPSLTNSQKSGSRPVSPTISIEDEVMDLSFSEFCTPPLSPRPSSSGIGACSTATKRPAASDAVMPKKRVKVQNGSGGNARNLIESLFGGVQITKVTCAECKSVYMSRDGFHELQLAYPEKPPNYRYCVQNLVDYYCSNETLDGENRYKCENCDTLRDADRCVIIDSMPKYLILVLKNFKYDYKRKTQMKLIQKTYHNSRIILPSTRTDIVNSYELYAGVIHEGESIHSGHYYTIGKDLNDWYLYNDVIIKKTNEFEINRLNRNSTAYILFYRRIDVVEIPPPPLSDLPPEIQRTVISRNKMMQR